MVQSAYWFKILLVLMRKSLSGFDCTFFYQPKQKGTVTWCDVGRHGGRRREQRRFRESTRWAAGAFNLDLKQVLTLALLYLQRSRVVSLVWCVNTHCSDTLEYMPMISQGRITQPKMANFGQHVSAYV